MYGNTNAPGAVATQSVPGLMSGEDKAKLDSVSMPVILTNQYVATLDSAAAGRPLRVTAHIQPVQAAGTPSPSNPLPITGWTGANVYVSPTTTAADGTVYAFTFPSSIGTVYGGTLDVTRGLLTLTWLSKTFTVFSYMNHVPYWPSTIETYAISNAIEPMWYERGSMCPNLFWFISVSDDRIPPYGYRHADSRDTLLVTLPSSYDTLEKANAWISENPVTIVYETSSPITYQLTPQQLVTLAGTNNVFADCGNVTVTHWPGNGTPVEPVEDGAEIEFRAGILRQIEELRNAVLAQGGGL